MRLSRMSAIIYLLLLAPAWASEWVVTRISGQAWIVSQGTSTAAVRAGMKLASGDTLRTAGRSRVRLERGANVILVGPDTVLSPRESIFSGTTILQPQGRIEVEVEKRDVPHFGVETPLLAAIVKGTRFTVTADRRDSKVRVSRGLVQVSQHATGQTADLGPGFGAKVAAAASQHGLQLSGRGALPEVHQGTPRSPMVQEVILSQAVGSGRGGPAPSGDFGGGAGSGSSDAAGSSSGKGSGGGSAGASSDSGGSKSESSGSGSSGSDNSGPGGGKSDSSGGKSDSGKEKDKEKDKEKTK